MLFSKNFVTYDFSSFSSAVVEFLKSPPNSAQSSVENSSWRSLGGFGLKPSHIESAIPVNSFINEYAQRAIVYKPMISPGMTPHWFARSVTIPRVKRASKGPPTTPNKSREACKIPPRN